MKKLLCLLMAAMMVFAIVGCKSGETAAPAPDAPDAPDAPVAANYKIGIITGTASQGDEEITQAAMMKEKYGDKIVTSTYPDNFTSEVETVINNAVAMASDPEVKVIVWCQSIPGTTAAIEKVKETRPDMVFICGTPGEDPNVIDAAADIVFQVDEPGCGITIPEQAAKQGAKYLVHYSFPRHMSYELIVARHENLKTYCAQYGITLIDETAPDPTGDQGMTGAHQFIIEDVPRKVAQYGNDICFFTTNCGMQEALIRSVFEAKAIYTLQCCPSPFHAFPSALGIDMTGHEADVDYMLEQLQAKVDEAGMQGRVSTWGVPCNMLFIEAGVEYAVKYCEGQTNGAHDPEVLKATIDEVAGDVKMTVTNYVDNGETIPHHYLVMADFVTF